MPFLPLASLQTASILLVFFKVREEAPRRVGGLLFKSDGGLSENENETPKGDQYDHLTKTEITAFFYAQPYLNGQI